MILAEMAHVLPAQLVVFEGERTALAAATTITTDWYDTLRTHGERLLNPDTGLEVDSQGSFPQGGSGVRSAGLYHGTLIFRGVYNPGFGNVLSPFRLIVQQIPAPTLAGFVGAISSVEFHANSRFPIGNGSGAFSSGMTIQRRFQVFERFLRLSITTPADAVGNAEFICSVVLRSIP